MARRRKGGRRSRTIPLIPVLAGLAPAIGAIAQPDKRPEAILNEYIQNQLGVNVSINGVGGAPSFSMTTVQKAAPYWAFQGGALILHRVMRNSSLNPKLGPVRIF